MARPAKRIEKFFFLKSLNDEQLPIKLLRNRIEYTLKLSSFAKESIVLRADRPIDGLKKHDQLNLIFDYRGQSVSFIMDVTGSKGSEITGKVPDFLYRHLVRSYSRTLTPEELQVQFTCAGERYLLNYPRKLESNDEDIIKNIDMSNIEGLIDQMMSWFKDHVSGHKLVIYDDAEIKPSSIEERIITELGKIYYLPSTKGSFPEIDPYPQKTLVTEEMVVKYLDSTTDPEKTKQIAADFVKEKRDAGIFSDIWVPILFSEYVIGYLHAWIDKEGRPPFGYYVVDTLSQFASILVFSLKENGAFDKGKLEEISFMGKVIDISVSGLLFACPVDSKLASILLLDKSLVVRLVNPRRTITINSKIVRNYKDKTQNYFGCRFLDMEPEDMRFLFECIYGKHFTDEDINFLAGSV